MTTLGLDRPLVAEGATGSRSSARIAGKRVADTAAGGGVRRIRPLEALPPPAYAGPLRKAGVVPVSLSQRDTRAIDDPMG
jgi:hypothetical protein